jgi:hypothetical protein
MIIFLYLIGSLLLGYIISHGYNKICYHLLKMFIYFDFNWSRTIINKILIRNEF